MNNQQRAHSDSTQADEFWDYATQRRQAEQARLAVFAGAMTQLRGLLRFRATRSANTAVNG